VSRSIRPALYGKNRSKTLAKMIVARWGASVACDLILYLLLLKEKEDDCGPGCP